MNLIDEDSSSQTLGAAKSRGGLTAVSEDVQKSSLSLQR